MATPIDPFASMATGLSPTKSPEDSLGYLPSQPTPTPPPPSRALSFSPDDRDMAIRTIWGEANGGGPDEMRAVASVIRNRSVQSGKTFSEVVREKRQFEPWDRRPQQLLALDPNSQSYQDIASVVDPILNGQEEDPTGGATHFYAPNAQHQLGRRPPSWDNGTGVMHGRQKFFRLPYGRESKPASNFGVDLDPNAPRLGFVGTGGVDPFANMGRDLPSVVPTQPGNLEPFNRPLVYNPDGSHSTTLSFSRGTAKGEVLVPSIVNGKQLSEDEAWAHYEKTGENLGTFKTPEEADQYATWLHNRQESYIQDNGLEDPFASMAAGLPDPQAPEQGFFSKFGEAGMAGFSSAMTQGGQSATAIQGGTPEVVPHTKDYQDPPGLADLADPKLFAQKMAYGLGESSPAMAAGIAAGGLASAAVGGPETPLGLGAGLAAGAVAAGATTVAQSIGPVFAQELQISPTDPEAAFDRAWHTAEEEGLIMSASWAAFGINPFKGWVKNILFQTAVVQPGVSMGGAAAQNVEAGRPAEEGLADVAVGAAAGTLLPATGHAGVHLLSKGLSGFNVFDHAKPLDPHLNEYGKSVEEGQKARDVDAEETLTEWTLPKVEVKAQPIKSVFAKVEEVSFGEQPKVEAPKVVKTKVQKRGAKEIFELPIEVTDLPRPKVTFGEATKSSERGDSTFEAYHGSLTPRTHFGEGTHVGVMHAASNRVRDVLEMPDVSRPFMAPKGQGTPTISKLTLQKGQAIELPDLGEWWPEDISKILYDRGIINEAEVIKVKNDEVHPFELLKQKGYKYVSYKNDFEGKGEPSYIILDGDSIVRHEPLPTPKISQSTKESQRIAIDLRTPNTEGPFRYEDRADGRAEVLGGGRPLNKELHVEAIRLGNALLDLKKKLGIKVPLRIHLRSQLDRVGVAGQAHTRFKGPEATHPGRYPYKDTFDAHIAIAVDAHQSAEQIWATLTHELGHILTQTELKKAPNHVKQALYSAFKKWRRSQLPSDTRYAHSLNRDNAVRSFLDLGGYSDVDIRRINELTPQERRYWLDYEEFLAEQVARWGTSNLRPMNVAEKWLKGMGNKLYQLFRAAKQKFGLEFRPEKAFEDWLNSRFDQTEMIGHEVYKELARETQAENARALKSVGDDPTAAVPQAGLTTAHRQMIGSLFRNSIGGVPPQLRADAAHADRMGRFFKWFLSLQQLAKVNKDLGRLQLYREDTAGMNLDVQHTMQKFHEVLKSWKGIGDEQSDKLANFIDDYMNMTYRTPEEERLKVVRMPTAEEHQALVQKHGLNPESEKVFRQIQKTFSHMLDKYEEVLVRDAAKITDEKNRAAKLAAISRQMDSYRKSPYFPAMRFGDYVVVLRDAAGHIRQREHYESQRQQENAARALEELKASGRMPSDYSINRFTIPKSARALIGMPPGLLEKMAEKLDLNPEQARTLEQLKFEYTPAQSFKHRFQQKKRTKGYSRDFKRAFANYGFYGSKHLARVKYIDQLREHVDAVRTESQRMVDGNKRSQIADFMDDHLTEMLNPTRDFPNIRAMTFFWTLGWGPAQAALNLSQMLITTYPLLASKFGDVKSLTTMMGVLKDMSTYYKKGTLTNATEGELKMLGELVKSGIISEALAPELAGMAEGRNLAKSFGGNVSERIASFMAESGAKLFGLAEQMNRRVTARAALRLALRHPDAKYVKDMVKENQRHYQQLRAEGWPEHEAAAVVTAADAVKATQFEYSREANPRIMRGKLRTVLIFKSFVQNTAFFLSNYPAAAARSVLIMGFLGGLMGIPGAEDLGDVLKAVGWRLFGKDFDLERETRKFVMDVSNETVDPGVVLHGLSRYGFGIPAALDMIGGTVGVDIPFPTLDRSKSFGIGQILPISPGALLGPPTDPNRTIAEQAQKASGTAFGVGFNMYRAFEDMQVAGGWDWKLAEKGMPRAVANVVRAGRYYTEGVERAKDGSTVVKFDPNEPEHMAEMLAVGMGYTPLRTSAAWDRIIAKSEVKSFWDLRRSMLLRQADVAYRNKDQEQIDSVIGSIKNYNNTLPEEARGQVINSKTLRASLTQRARQRALKEKGIAQSKKDQALMTAVDRLYPDANILEVEKVK